MWSGSAGPGDFETLGIRLIAGRSFTPEESMGINLTRAPGSAVPIDHPSRTRGCSRASRRIAAGNAFPPDRSPQGV